MNKVAVLYTTPSGNDISLDEVLKTWDNLSKIPGVSYTMVHFDGFPTAEEFNQKIEKDVDAILGVWITPKFLNETFFDAHPNVTYIAGLAHGYQELDWALTRSRGITITNTMYGEYTIAEYAFSLLLDICKQTSYSSQHVKKTDWTNTQKRYMAAPVNQVELYQKTFGIIGLGAIGFRAAKMAEAFGMNVIAYNRSKKTDTKYDFIKQVSFQEVLGQADVISLHIALNEHTKNIINKEAISKMKDGAILINTARGSLIDEQALTEALQSGKIYGAGLDVLVNEPPLADDSLLTCDNALITPHIAWMPKTCRLRQLSMAIDNYESYLNGNPVSVIN